MSGCTWGWTQEFAFVKWRLIPLGHGIDKIWYKQEKKIPKHQVLNYVFCTGTLQYKRRRVFLLTILYFRSSKKSADWIFKWKGNFPSSPASIAFEFLETPKFWKAKPHGHQHLLAPVCETLLSEGANVVQQMANQCVSRFSLNKKLVICSRI